MTGLQRIAAAFAAASAQDRAVLMPYFTLGYPTPEQSLDLIQAIAASGAGIIELGVPFSDPLADGPTIQHSTQVALQHGVDLPTCLRMVTELRLRGIDQPLLLMGYYNPVLNFGLDSFVMAARSAGVDGLIIPDLPPEESGELEALCQAAGIALIYLVAPTSTPERLRQIAARTTGFTYVVSLTGVTGERQGLPLDLVDFLTRLRRLISTPLAVGFGISTPEQAAQVARHADGVIIGSALISLAGSAANPIGAVRKFVTELASACQR